MVVNEATFRDALNLCGVVSEAVRNAICITQGITDMGTFATLSVKEIDAMAVAISKMPRVAGQGQLLIPQVALKNLKAMREWTIWESRKGFVLDHETWDEDELEWQIERMDYEDRVASSKVEASSKPSALKSLTGWRSFWKQFDAYCQQARGTMFLPLAYVYRVNEVVDPQAHLRIDYPNSDVQLTETVALSGKDFKIDNIALWNVLAPLVMDGTAWAFIKSFERSKDGRAAVLALKNQAEGNASEQTRKAEAYKTLQTLQYSGKAKKVSYDNYVEKLQFAFTELLDCGEEMSESRKVNHLLRGIKSDRLNAAFAHITGTPILLNDFNQANAYIKSMMAQMSSFETGDQLDNRGVSGVSTDGDGKGKSDIAYYEPNEWFALSQEQRAEVLKNRAAKKSGKSGSKKRKGGGGNSGGNNQGTTTSKKGVKAYRREIKALKAQVAAAGKSGDSSSDDDDESSPDVAGAGGAGNQFGRQQAGGAKNNKKKKK